MMNARMKSIFACAALALALAISASPALANLVIDPSYEDITAPFLLPGLGGVVGPPFTPGFWGAENSTIVTAENNITPMCDVQMLRMEDEGLFVTQAFQAVYVGADSICIDSGLARVTLSAWFNAVGTPGAPPVEGGVMLYFYNCATCWGNFVPFISTPINLDYDPSTWELSLATGAIPAGTRWVLVQTGFTDATLLGHPGYVDCVELDVDTSGCSPSPVDAASWGQIKALYK
jgi:hypothetical protein